jgi:hypothetical protein
VVNTPRPLYREEDPVFIAHDRSGRVRKISPLLGFDLRTFRLEGSRYAD